MCGSYFCKGGKAAARGNYFCEGGWVGWWIFEIEGVVRRQNVWCPGGRLDLVFR